MRIIDLVAAMHIELRYDDWRRERFTSPRGEQHRVTRILTGKLTPSLGEACAIAEVLGVPSQVLFPEVATGPHPLLGRNGCEPAWSWSSRSSRHLTGE